jgi:acetylornithine deacetylase/succinyl-diaminopimelate desuccinylase-like protein
MALSAQIVAAISPALAAPKSEPARDPAFLAMLKEMVETDSSFASGSCTAVVDKIAARMKAGGFPEKNLHVFIPEGHPKEGNLVAILPGKDPKAKAVLMSGHIDVVNAKREDWTRDPYTMIEEGGYYYGRGVADMKAQDAIWIDSMLRYTKEGYKPTRTIKMALTCGEEGQFLNGIGWLLENQRDLIDAGIAFNEGGYGELDEATGKKLAITVLAAEKGGGNFVLEVTNPGGHSSRPRPDNAIYALAKGLDNLSHFAFPIDLNQVNRAYFTKMAPLVGGEMGKAMTALMANPNDAAADAIVSKSPNYNAMLRTVCTPTLLSGGHAANALPQRARATVNCRTLPGMSRATVKEAIIKAVNMADVVVSGSDAPDPPIKLAPLSKAALGPMEAAAKKAYPGIPVVPMQATGGTDGKRMIQAGIPTYGVSGMFRESDFSNAHGLNERMLSYTVWEGREFLYQMVKAYAEAPEMP